MVLDVVVGENLDLWNSVHILCCPWCEGEGALCRIPIENILAVERLEEESFKMKNVRDNVTHTRVLYN